MASVGDIKKEIDKKIEEAKAKKLKQLSGKTIIKK
jgi:hypothetical protein